MLLRFVALVVYDRPPDLLLKEWGKLAPGDSVARMGLGALFHVLDVLDAQLRQQPPPRLSLFGFGARPLLPAHGKGSLPGTRNSFMHFNAETPASLEERRSRAMSFVEGVDGLLRYLQEPVGRMFPRVIAIRGVHYDQWGRRLVQAEDEDGAMEALFTEAALRPGEVYFMHPLSNPIRVDPLLIPAGDLQFPASG